jgi:hypothetical protein
MKTNTAIAQVESNNLSDFAQVMKGMGRGHEAGPTPGRINLEPDNPKNGLAQLVLTLVKLLHELLERQGIRRMEAGTLTDAEIERLGLTLMKQAQEIDRLRREFGLAEEDLNLDLGPFGKLL